MSAGNIETIVTRQSKGLSNEKRSLPTCILFATLKWYNLKIKVEFKKSCLKWDNVAFTQRNVVSLFIVYELDACSRDLNTVFTPKDCLFGAVKLTRNADTDKYFYSG